MTFLMTFRAEPCPICTEFLSFRPVLLSPRAHFLVLQFREATVIFPKGLASVF